MKRLVAFICFTIFLIYLVGSASADTTYVVQYGDTLYRIALNHDVSMQAIMEANGIGNADVIYVGQVLTIPDGSSEPQPTQPSAPQPTQPPAPQPTAPPSGGTTHIVQRGETLAGIGRQYNVTVASLVIANNLANANYIYVGQRLTIPGTGSPQPTQPAQPQPTQLPTSPPPQPTTPATGEITHVVQAGETTASIARRYDVTINAIVVANNLANPNFIYVGQQLRIPLGQPQPSTAPPQPTSPPAATPTTMPTAPAPTTVPPTAVPPTAIPPTATALPPAPTAVPTVGPNVLPNYSFEEGHYNLNGIPELQVPTSWRFEWTEGDNQFGTTYLRPESRVLSGAFLPAFERPLFIYDGWHTVKVFKGYGPISFRLLSDVNLTPGTYELTVQVFPDMVVEVVNGNKIFASDPRAAEIALFGNGASSGYLLPVIGQRNVIAHQFRVDQAGVVTVGAEMRGRYVLQSSGFFTDAWSLKRIGD